MMNPGRWGSAAVVHRRRRARRLDAPYDCYPATHASGRRSLRVHAHTGWGAGLRIDSFLIGHRVETGAWGSFTCSRSWCGSYLAANYCLTSDLISCKPITSLRSRFQCERRLCFSKAAVPVNYPEELVERRTVGLRLQVPKPGREARSSLRELRVHPSRRPTFSSMLHL
jgi:hypothetical protein